ncbi:hypothetical protein P7C70_g4858, partial [Phenoliferia sp. Uapishka_3]
MKTTFLDEDQFKYALGDLRKFVSKQKRRGKPDKLSKISKVYFKFSEITTYLKSKKTISSQEESRYFLSILPTDIVDMIYDRRATRQLVRAEEHDGRYEEDEDDQGALPEIHDIMKELRSIFNGFAKRGKTSRIRSKNHYDSSDASDSESSSEKSGSSDEDMSESDDSESDRKSVKSKGSHGSRKSSNSRSSKSSKSDDSKSAGRKWEQKEKKGGEVSQGKDDIVLKDFLRDLQVQVAQLTTAQKSSAAIGSNGGSSYQQKKPFIPYNQGRNQMSQPNPAPYVNKWGAKHRDGPPHDIQNNNAEYEGFYEMNYAGTAPPAQPAGGKNPWPMKTGNEPMFNAPPPKVPSCLWCVGEDGVHWMNGCADMHLALESRVIQRGDDGKVKYGHRYIPTMRHPRGMRGWVKEQEKFAEDASKIPKVKFDANISTNSIEYEPPEISSGQQEYASAQVKIDKYEVNQGKRDRSTSSTDVPKKKADTKTPKNPKSSLFERLGVPKQDPSVLDEEDAVMSEGVRKRAPRAKLESPLESKADPRALLDSVLEQTITIPLHRLLENSTELSKMMANECKKKRTPLGNVEANTLSWEEDYRNYLRVNHQHFEKSKEGRKPYYAGVLAYTAVTIQGEPIKGLLDNGSMICMMREDVRKRLGLPIRTDGSHRVRMAGGGLETLLGICENVPIKIGGITTHVHFFVSRASSNAILLGQNFLRQVEARFQYHADGSVLMGMTHKGRQITVEVTGKDEARYLANVPGDGESYDSSMVAIIREDGSFADQPRICQKCGVSAFDHMRGCPDLETVGRVSASGAACFCYNVHGPHLVNTSARHYPECDVLNTNDCYFCGASSHHYMDCPDSWFLCRTYRREAIIQNQIIDSSPRMRMCKGCPHWQDPRTVPLFKTFMDIPEFLVDMHAYIGLEKYNEMYPPEKVLTSEGLDQYFDREIEVERVKKSKLDYVASNTEAKGVKQKTGKRRSTSENLCLKCGTQPDHHSVCPDVLPSFEQLTIEKKAIKQFNERNQRVKEQHFEWNPFYRELAYVPPQDVPQQPPQKTFLTQVETAEIPRRHTKVAETGCSYPVFKSEIQLSNRENRRGNGFQKGNTNELELNKSDRLARRRKFKGSGPIVRRFVNGKEVDAQGNELWVDSSGVSRKYGKQELRKLRSYNLDNTTTSSTNNTRPSKQQTQASTNNSERNETRRSGLDNKFKEIQCRLSDIEGDNMLAREAIGTVWVATDMCRDELGVLTQKYHELSSKQSMKPVMPLRGHSWESYQPLTKLNSAKMYRKPSEPLSPPTELKVVGETGEELLRKQKLQDEYNRFLHVLFGREIREMREDASKSEDSSQESLQESDSEKETTSHEDSPASETYLDLPFLVERCDSPESFLTQEEQEVDDRESEQEERESFKNFMDHVKSGCLQTDFDDELVDFCQPAGESYVREESEKENEKALGELGLKMEKGLHVSIRTQESEQAGILVETNGVFYEGTFSLQNASPGTLLTPESSPEPADGIFDDIPFAYQEPLDSEAETFDHECHSPHRRMMDELDSALERERVRREKQDSSIKILLVNPLGSQEGPKLEPVTFETVDSSTPEEDDTTPPFEEEDLQNELKELEELEKTFETTLETGSGFEYIWARDHQHWMRSFEAGHRYLMRGLGFKFEQSQDELDLLETELSSNEEVVRKASYKNLSKWVEGYLHGNDTPSRCRDQEKSPDRSDMPRRMDTKHREAMAGFQERMKEISWETKKERCSRTCLDTCECEEDEKRLERESLEDSLELRVNGIKLEEASTYRRADMVRADEVTPYLNKRHNVVQEYIDGCSSLLWVIRINPLGKYELLAKVCECHAEAGFHVSFKKEREGWFTRFEKDHRQLMSTFGYKPSPSELQDLETVLEENDQSAKDSNDKCLIEWLEEYCYDVLTYWDDEGPESFKSWLNNVEIKHRKAIREFKLRIKQIAGELEDYKMSLTVSPLEVDPDNEKEVGGPEPTSFTTNGKEVNRRNSYEDRWLRESTHGNLLLDIFTKSQDINFACAEDPLAKNRGVAFSRCYAGCGKQRAYCTCGNNLGSQEELMVNSILYETESGEAQKGAGEKNGEDQKSYERKWLEQVKSGEALMRSLEASKAGGKARIELDEDKAHQDLMKKKGHTSKCKSPLQHEYLASTVIYEMDTDCQGRAPTDKTNAYRKPEKNEHLRPGLKILEAQNSALEKVQQLNTEALTELEEALLNRSTESASERLYRLYYEDGHESWMQRNEVEHRKAMAELGYKAEVDPETLKDLAAELEDNEKLVADMNAWDLQLWIDEYLSGEETPYLYWDQEGGEDHQDWMEGIETRH